MTDVAPEQPKKRETPLRKQIRRLTRQNSGLITKLKTAEHWRKYYQRRYDAGLSLLHECCARVDVNTAEGRQFKRKLMAAIAFITTAQDGDLDE